jgi:hypothetical protein
MQGELPPTDRGGGSLGLSSLSPARPSRASKSNALQPDASRCAAGGGPSQSMVVSVAWAAENLYPEATSADLLARLPQKLYRTNGRADAPPPLQRFAAAAPLAELLAAFDRDGAVIVRGVYTADEVAEFRQDHDLRLVGLAEHIDAHPSSYTRRPFVDPHYDRKPEWVAADSHAGTGAAERLGASAAGRLEKVAAGLDAVTKALNSDVVTNTQSAALTAGTAITADGAEAVESFSPDGKVGRIIAMGEHRWEFYSDFEDGSRYAEDTFRFPGPVRPFLDAVLQGNLRNHVGALTTTGRCADGGWHRDPGSLFDDEKLDLAIPEFYVTMLVPLGTTGADNGATEFILGSHKMTVEECVNAEELRFGMACAEVGDIVLFVSVITTLAACEAASCFSH